jgi:quinolinate synthase
MGLVENKDSQSIEIKSKIKRLLKQEDAIIVAHYYTDFALQQLAEETGGLVADSLEMARFCSEHPANTIVLAGVYFMAETVKILSPEKRVLMPDLSATCSLDVGCSADKFGEFCEENPDRVKVAYVNTSAGVKAQADWIVTSRIAIQLIEHLHRDGSKILWAPDKHMGRYVAEKTGADMVIWDGSCVVHNSFKVNSLKQLKQIYPHATILAHPEAPYAILEIADVVGSTTEIIKAAVTIDNDLFIVATDRGILTKLRHLSPNKTFIEAPSGGVGATCKSCAHCPWMGLNKLYNLLDVLENKKGEIHIADSVIDKARIPLERMLDFSSKL